MTLKFFALASLIVGAQLCAADVKIQVAYPAEHKARPSWCDCWNRCACVVQYRLRKALEEKRIKAADLKILASAKSQGDALIIEEQDSERAKNQKRASIQSLKKAAKAVLNEKEGEKQKNRPLSPLPSPTLLQSPTTLTGGQIRTITISPASAATLWHQASRQTT